MQQSKIPNLGCTWYAEFLIWEMLVNVGVENMSEIPV